ncbi:thioredoxin-domain-containing protein [Neoconidiobolus thromboides FSU 785]|nr:thioredoxin-domain-containing protein [Neoconidiobolus thromboides FSU 785]
MRLTNLLNLTTLALFFNSVTSQDNQASKDLTNKNEQLVKQGFWFVKLYSPTCKHCKRLAPHWVKFTESLQDWAKAQNFNFGEVNCLKEGKLCSTLKADGYPTINLFKDGVYQKECLTYEGVDQLLICIKEYAKKYHLELPKQLKPKQENKPEPAKNAELEHHQEPPKVENHQEPPKVENHQEPPKVENQPQPKVQVPVKQNLVNKIIPNPNGQVKKLTTSTFDEELKKGAWFIKFFAPWCGHCQTLAPTWTKLASDLQNTINIGQVDCTEEKSLCKDYTIRGYPTLKFIQNDKQKDYFGERTLDALKTSALKSIGPKNTIDYDEIKKLIKDESYAIIYYNPQDNDIPPHINNILYNLEAQTESYHINKKLDSLKELNIQDHPALIIVKDGSYKLYNEDINNVESFNKWYIKEKDAIVRELDLTNFEQYLKVNNNNNQIAIVKIIRGGSNKEDNTYLVKEKKKFRDIAHPILRRSDKQMFFAIIDGNKYEKEVKNYLNHYGDESHIVIIDLKEKKLYDKSNESSKIEHKTKDIEKAIDDYYSSKLEGQVINFTPKYFTLSTLTSLPFLTILIPVILVCALIYFFVTSEDSEQDKKAI